MSDPPSSSARGARRPPAAPVQRAVLATPIGPVEIAASAEGVVEVLFINGKRRARPPGPESPSPLLIAWRALERYFDGDDLGEPVPLALAGTGFQRQVWAAITGLPRGHTTSYGTLAAALGRPQAVRSVGAACGANPVPVLVPCHRVLGADGSLTGFAGGIERKRWLLEFEGVLLRL